MLSKSKASPYIVTLILSFVLSDYTISLMRIKLKTYIKHSFYRLFESLVYIYEVRQIFKFGSCIIRKVSVFLHATFDTQDRYTTLKKIENEKIFRNNIVDFYCYFV
jgi:hypothetical protein